MGSRTSLTIRDAEMADARLIKEILVRTRSMPSADLTVKDIRASIKRAAEDDEMRILVGTVADEVIGMVHLRCIPVGPFTDDKAVLTSFLLVHPEHRRHGYAHHLFSAAVAWAEEQDIQQVNGVAHSTVREANRFYARLGMSAAASLRSAQTGALRARLLAERATRETGANRKVRATLAQRRNLRRRQQGTSGPAIS
ncbi:MAG TPA: GNAT family N-acetyltransferase [Marmoricola sp.]|nr:GNAT family N-acetyltransferase [Marmoricola sp.]HNI69687.1 GNAT family N-acetyltransferase [Marmoricola sp.]HNJ79510.1 GNAT family N-acetyltransferase [Marmoricola sp.]